MNPSSFFKPLIPHLIAVGASLVIIFIYFSPTLSGKRLIQSDIIQISGTLKEAIDYQKKTGKEVLWSNSSFAGMPVWRGYGNNILTHFHYFINDILPSPVLLCLLGFIGFYLLLIAFGLNPWLAFAGGLAYTFASFNFISIEAGHINKVYDMALMAPVLAGIVFAFNGKYWTGIGLSTLFVSLHIYYGHFQITYYLIMLIAFYAIFKLVQAIKGKQLPFFFKTSALLIIAALLGVTPNVSKLWTTSEYSKSTTRGGSELSTKEVNKQGLDKEYALQWSNGISETMTLFIPYFYGGSSHEDLGKSSEVYKVLAKNGYKNEAKEFAKSVPLYWGDQPFTAGPVYLGAIVCFLFILGLFIVQSDLKWWITGVTVMAIMLSCGRHIEWFTDIFFSYVPLYDKFRSVTMILCIAQVTFPLIGFLALKEIVEKRISVEKILNGLKWTTIITGGTALFFALLGSVFFDFSSVNDAQTFQRLPDWLQEAIKSDRESVMRMDSLRSLFFVLAAAGLIWTFLKNMIVARTFYMILIALTLIDLAWVDKRYLSNEDFKFKKDYEKQVYVKSAADELILEDKDPNFKVLNYTKGITGDGITSYYHKSLGGYSAIKLRRYQDVIDSCLNKNKQEVINMLNTKYFIGADKQGGEIAQRNPGALGNAWFVSSVRYVKSADEEIKAIQDFNPDMIAIVDEKFKEQLQNKTFSKDSSGKIVETFYSPDKLSYKSKAGSEQLAVFSEIYYQPGWNAYIDGKLTPHVRANYILRAMIIPAGEHSIDFVFEPQSYYLGEKISFGGSAILVIFLLVLIARVVIVSRKEQKQEEPAS
jgi:hypothetical protein